MKFLIGAFLFLLFSQNILAQKGFVQTTEDSTIVGYLRFYKPVHGPRGLEVWKTKTDKNPRRVAFEKVYAFAIKKDTFRMLRQFRPFDDSQVYFELVEARVRATGKVNLYSIPYQDQSMIMDPVGGPMLSLMKIDPNITQGHILVLEKPSTGYRRALSSMMEPRREALRDFFPDSFIARYEKKGRIPYKVIPEMVKAYNGARR